MPNLRKSPPEHACELDVAEGLGSFAREELARVLGERAQLWGPQERRGPDVVRFGYSGSLRALLRLKAALAAYLVRGFAVPRPKALLSNEHLPVLLEQIALVRSMHPPEAFQTLELGAAGADSPVMTRLKEELARRSGLTVAAERGDLFLRLRHPPDGGTGWELLTRISPRPLATRAWRVCNMEGALNATVAHAMAQLTRPAAGDTLLNIGCGSGTLLVERLSIAPAARAIGCDINPVALECARTNLAAAGFAAEAELHGWDARALALPDASVSALLADLPFGHLVGSHAHNLELYPALLTEAARVAAPGAPCVLISHEVRLLEGLLASSPHWSIEQTMRVTLGGLHPRIFVLRRAKAPSPSPRTSG